MKPFDTSYSSLLRIALPLSLGAFVQFLVVLTDNLFLVRVSETALNGAGNGGMLYITAVMLGVGLSAGLQIMAARRKGANELKEIGSWLGVGLRLSVFLGAVLYLLFWSFDQWLYVHLLRSEEILDTMKSFLRVRSIGLFVYMPLLMFTGFYTGIAKTRILMFSMGLTAGINILFNWLLIFGNGPFPAMEHEGAALATLIAESCGLVFLATYTLVVYRKAPYHLLEGLFTRVKGMQKQLLLLSYPLMIQQVLALATWTTFYFLVEKVGGMELKVSHIVRNTYMLAFVTVMGIGHTTRTVVSTLIAENRQADLAPTIQRLIFLNLGGVALLCHGLLLYPEALAGLFFPVGDPGIVPLTQSFQVVFFAISIFAISSVLLNTVEGSGRTRQGMFIEIASIATYLFFVYQVTVVSPQPIHIIWMTDYVYFAVLGILALLYLRFSNWKYTQV